jgi:hypothetical protein
MRRAQKLPFPVVLLALLARNHGPTLREPLGLSVSFSSWSIHHPTSLKEIKTQPGCPASSLIPKAHFPVPPLRGYRPKLGSAILVPVIDSHKSEGSRHFIGTRPGTL